MSVVRANTLLRLRVLKATMLIRCAATASRGGKGGRRGRANGIESEGQGRKIKGARVKGEGRMAKGEEGDIGERREENYYRGNMRRCFN